MKRFIIKLSLYLLLVFVVFSFINFYARTIKVDGSEYLAATIDKHNRIKEFKNEPLLILAGGSNLAFGINSNLIQKEIKLPVVNLGLHAGLGYKYIINELKNVIKSGDVVILSLEYYSTPNGQYRLKHKIGEIYPPAKNFYSKSIWFDLNKLIESCESNLKLVLSKNKNIAEKKYLNRHSFNKYGDYIGHLKAKKINKLIGRRQFETHRWEGLDLLNEFHDFAASINVDVYFVYPPYPKSEFNKNHAALKTFELDMKRELNFKVISTSSAFTFPEKYFHNTVYHLNKYGRKKRTEKLIDVLKSDNEFRKYIKHKYLTDN